MCMWMIPYHIATAHIHIGQAFRSYLECWIPPEDKTKQSFLVEALTHSRWLPHQCQTHKMCFTTSVCYGCAYGWVLTTLPLLALTKLLEVTYDSGCLGGLKEFRLPPKDQTKESFVVEAIDTFKITLPLHQCQTSYRGVSQPPYALYVHHMDELYHIPTAHVGQAFGRFT